MPSNSAVDQTRVTQMARAWSLRQRGWSQHRIAEAIGVSQPTVCKWLDAINARELKRLSARVEAMKVEQDEVLKHIVCEALEAWERSKQPKKRAKSQTGVGGAVTVSEATEREGEPAYLAAAFGGLDRLRALWGLNSPAKREDDQAGGFSFSAIAARLRQNAANHDAERKALPAPESKGGDSCPSQ